MPTILKIFRITDHTTIIIQMIETILLSLIAIAFLVGLARIAVFLFTLIVAFWR